MDTISWPTVLTSSVAAIVVALLTILFGEPLRRWVNRKADIRDRKRDDELQAIDGFIAELSRIEGICIGAGEQKPFQEAVASQGRRELQGLASVLPGMAARLPPGLKPALDQLAKDLGDVSGPLLLGFSEPPGSNGRMVAYIKVAAFTNNLRTARSAAETLRSKLFGR